MDGVVAALLMAACLAGVMGAFTWLARLVRRRGLAGTAIRAAMAAYEEGWHVSGYEAHQELRVQASREVPTPAPNDSLEAATSNPGSGEGPASPQTDSSSPFPARRRYGKWLLSGDR